jgi:tetratricopeptide (TPR) repeat protein
MILSSTPAREAMMGRGPGVPRPAVVFAAVLFCGALSSALLAAWQAPADERFDNQVRADMFAGLAGDAAALDRAMKRCEETLAQDPENTEALVWHGSGSIFLGGQAMRSADYAKGGPLLAKGLREMDDAVAKAPDRVGVLIPRGATLLEYSKYDPMPEHAQAELQKALGDFEKVLVLQKPDWQNRPLHARGELLSGLAEGWYRAGDVQKARSYMERLVAETAGSPYAARAQVFLSASAPPKQLDWHCIGCHVSSASQ